MKRLLTLVLLVACGVALASASPPHPKVDVAALVRQLGSEDFQEREEASRQLSALPVDEPPAELLAALKSPNPEVRERAAKAVKTIRDAAPLRRLARDERFAARGKLDLYVASTKALDPALKDDDERLWLPAFNLGARVVAGADAEGDRKPRCPSVAENFPKFCVFWKPMFFRTDAVQLTARKNANGEPVEGYVQVIQAAKVEASQSLQGLIVSRGQVTAVNINSSLVLATGDVTAASKVAGSVIVCDGDVRAGKSLSHSVVIARGNITVEGSARSSTLIAGGTVTVGRLPTPVPLQDDPKQIINRQTRVIIQEKDTNPLGFITFFELRQIGLEVKAVNKVVQVSKVAPGFTGAKAGLKAGDVILEAAGKKPADAESLRRLLRDALAVGDAAVKLKRGNATLTVKLTLPE